MFRKEKLLKKFFAVPVRNDLTYNELKTLLLSLGNNKTLRGGHAPRGRGVHYG